MKNKSEFKQTNKQTNKKMYFFAMQARLNVILWKLPWKISANFTKHTQLGFVLNNKTLVSHLK